MSAVGGVGVLRRLRQPYLRRRYTILFYSLLLTLGIGPLLSAWKFDVDLVQVSLAFNLLVAMVGVGERRRWRAAELVLAAAIGIRMLAAWLHADSLAAASLPLWTAIAFLATARAVTFFMRARAVDAEHVYAALSAYLLAGLFFGVLYTAIERTWPGSFAIDGHAADGGLSITTAIYFSFVTLATLGYGDIVPRSDVARGLAIVQAVAGQFFLAVLLARLVTLYARDGGRPTPD